MTINAAHQNTPTLQKTIDEITESGFLGVQVHVTDQHGHWTGNAGTAGADIAHVRIGSNTKTFTATLVLQLNAEGRLDLVPEGFDTYLTHFEHALEDTRLITLTRRAAEAATWQPDDPRIAELATETARHYLANPALLATVTGMRARTEAATRYNLIAHHGDQPTPATTRLITLFENELRAAGVQLRR